MSAKPTKIGKAIIPAMTLGKTKYSKGSVDNVFSASICSVTFIVPSSAAIAAETLPATTIPPKTGPSSLVIPKATIEETIISELN